MEERAAKKEMEERSETVEWGSSLTPLQEQKLALKKALKFANSISTPRSRNAPTHQKVGAATTGISAGCAVAAREGSTNGLIEQSANLEHENSRLHMRIAELEKLAESTGRAVADTADLADKIFQEFVDENSTGQKMTRNDFKRAVMDLGGTLVGATLDDLFNDMDTNGDNFIDPDEWRVFTRTPNTTGGRLTLRVSVCCCPHLC